MSNDDFAIPGDRMSILNCYVDDETMRWLEKASVELGRNIEELAEAAISEAAIEFKVSRMRQRSPQDTSHE